MPKFFEVFLCFWYFLTRVDPLGSFWARVDPLGSFWIRVRVAGAAAPLMGVGAAGCRWLLVRDADVGGAGPPRFGRVLLTSGMRPPRGGPSPFPAVRAARARG